MSGTRIHQLANGLRIVTEFMPGLESAAIGLWVGAGGRHEGEGENGVAHFLEHMAFKGTARRSARDIAEAIENVGGYINAYTGREATAYYVRCLGRDAGLALDVIADIVTGPAFNAPDIETERNVILQEIGLTNDTPDDIIFDWLHETSYPGQAFGRSILGPEERIRGLSAADLRGFTARHYGPDRMIVSAAGAVDHDALAAQAEALLSPLVPVGAPAGAPARFATGERRVRRRLEQAHFALNLEAPGLRDPALYASQVWAMALGGGMSSRLFQKIREERGLCYTISAQTSHFDDTGHLTIYAGTSGEDVAPLAALAVEELRRAVDDLTGEEIARARAQLVAGLLMAMEGPAARAERNARVLALWGRVPPLHEAVERIEAVDLAAARDWGCELLRARAALALYGPVAAAPSVEAIREGLAA